MSIHQTFDLKGPLIMISLPNTFVSVIAIFAPKVDQWYGEGPREVEVATNTAVWYYAGKPPVAIRWVLIRDPQEPFKPQALLSTHLEHTPEQILTWFVRRWRVEVTFEEARAHLGIETQRQWNDLAIACTTPALLSLFSIITLIAHFLIKKGTNSVRSTAWYTKTDPTFSDAIKMRDWGARPRYAPDWQATSGCQSALSLSGS